MLLTTASSHAPTSIDRCTGRQIPPGTSRSGLGCRRLQGRALNKSSHKKRWGQRRGCGFGRHTAAVVQCAVGWECKGSVRAEGLRFGIVVAKFNDLITERLLQGALAAIERHGGGSEENCGVVWVPGSFELPVVAKSMAKSGEYDAIICIGAVIRGSTTHYDAVAGAAYSGALNASVDTGIPIIFGVLTCENMEQALDRAGGKMGNRGFDAGVSAIEMASLMAQLRQDMKAAPAWL